MRRPDRRKGEPRLGFRLGALTPPITAFFKLTLHLTFARIPSTPARLMVRVRQRGSGSRGLWGKHMRILRFAVCLSLPMVALLAGLNAAAAQGDPRELCVSDALRLCNDFIPDEHKITRCMLAKRAQLSAPCRNAMHPGWRGGRHYHHRAVRHCRHGHC